ncbi:MAG TPA: D-glycero-beta-D-manno-heptose-7-phosphate kinase [Chloroflexota bacterium]|nr:D-glycero-beta-D-manno-heptose-7-phosphate kinase [Chloroflexota bacterium]
MGTNYEELVQGFGGVKVTVVGDLMLDRYLAGRVQRISPEAPVPVVEVERVFERPGGAGNVATNTQRLGAPTTIIGIIGADPDGERLKDVLASEELSVGALVQSSTQPTTVKTRVVAHGQQIVRVDREASASVEGDLAEQLLAAFDAAPSDVVILSDYAKGVLSPVVCAEVIRRARTRGIPVVVDPKGRDYQRYQGATAVTPNQAEAILAIGGDGSGELKLDQLREFLLGELRLDAALVTRGERGMTLLLPEEAPISFPATAREVADVTGAGDTAVSVFALGLATGADFARATFVANVAAGLAVGRAGAVAISPGELLEALQPHHVPRARRARG